MGPDHYEGTGTTHGERAGSIGHGYNALLGISVLMFTVAWLSGTFALLEHPMEPGSTVSASIWRLEMLKFLAGLPQVQKLVVYQGFFGAVSPKPTTLLVAHGPPHAGDIFRQFQTRRLCPTNTSIGRDETGKFRTSALIRPIHMPYARPLQRFGILQFRVGW